MKNYRIRDLTQKLKDPSCSVILFGAGRLGKLALFSLTSRGINVRSFCDSNVKKQGKSYCDLPVISPEEILDNFSNVHVFICNNYLELIVPLLNKLNIANVYDCLDLVLNTNFSESSLNFSEEDDPQFRHKPLDIPRVIGFHQRSVSRQNIQQNNLQLKYVDIVITERCSMKCVDCSNLMQYYLKPIDSEIAMLFLSIDRLMKCVEDVFEARVIGGEPLVNKQLHKIIRRLVTYNVQNIVIYTNGTIVPKGETLSCLKHDKVKFDISNYGSQSRNHDNLINVLEENKIPYITRRVDQWTDCGRIEYRNRTEEEVRQVFFNCCVSDVLTILNGKLYRCPFSANAMNLEAIPIDEDDVIDLCQTGKSLDTLKLEIERLYNLKERKEYLTACSYCGGRDYTSKVIPAAIQTKTPLALPTN